MVSTPPVAAVRVAVQVDPVLWIETEGNALVDVLRAKLPDAIAADLFERADAGANLVYALYHLPAETMAGLPPQLLRAYTRACEAYRIGNHRPDRS